MSAASQDRLVQLYQETIRRHAAEPTGFRKAIRPTHRHEAWNPLCGDRVEIQLRVADEKIEAAAFDGEACSICMASASILCDLVASQPVALLRRLHDDLQQALRDRNGAGTAPGVPGEDDSTGSSRQGPPLPDELHPLLGVRPYPSRIRCATLPWTAAVGALDGGHTTVI